MRQDGNDNQNKKNKPAFKALILLAKELEKNDHSSISISEENKRKQAFDLIPPMDNSSDLSEFFNLLSDFPTLDELRIIAWPKIS